MTTLSELLAEHTTMGGETADHLQRVVGEWQLLADMSFADFLLWVPLDDLNAVAEDGTTSRASTAQFLCVAQARPTTAPTAHPDDVVGRRAATVEGVFLDVDGDQHLAVLLDDDPSADIQRAQGRFMYFHPDEVEPLP